MARTPKAKSQTGHALRRAYERYGLRLTEHHLRDLVKRIQNNEAQYVVAQSLRIAVFDATVPNPHPTPANDCVLCPVRVVYDRDRKTIVTFLHPDQGYV